MKLYEFTYSTCERISTSERERRVLRFLKDEAALQGWASGYTWKLVKVETQAGVKCRCNKSYLYEVSGDYDDRKL